MAANVSFGEEEGGALTDINVTPLVDVVLVLLIVFMITVPTVIGSAPIKVNLPLTEAALDTSAEQLPISISLKREGNEVALYYNTDKVTDSDFRRRLQNLRGQSEQQVSIAADRDIAYNDVVHVMDLLAEVGIHKIWLPTKHVAGR
jgi:biopolymer transport protein ExbD